MKPALHPKYYNDCQVVCSCGHTFSTGSTLPEIKVEICAACHPFFTGEVKYIDAMGRVEKFKQRQAASSGQKYLKKKERKSLKVQQAMQKAKNTPKTLKDMLKKAQKTNKTQTGRGQTSQPVIQTTAKPESQKQAS